MPEKLSNVITTGVPATNTISTHNYLNGAVVYTSAGGVQTTLTSTNFSMNITGIPTTTGIYNAYTTTFIINQTGNNKGYIRGVSINNTNITPEFVGGTLPTITAATSTILQTITTIVSTGIVLKVLTNANVCNGV